MTREAVDAWSRALRALNTAYSISSEDPDGTANRAYYAAFHALTTLFLLRGHEFGKHKAVEVAVHRELVKTGAWSEGLGRDYSWLVRLRATGDYGSLTHVSDTDAQRATGVALQVLEAVHAALPPGFDPPPPRS